MLKRSIRKKISIGNGEENNYLSSVSDLMSGLLFIFIIALMIFMIHAKYKAHEANLATKNLYVATQELKQKQVELEQMKNNLLDSHKIAQELKNTQDELKTIQRRLTNNNQARSELLEHITEAAKTIANIQLNIDPERGILRIPESAISFKTGSAEVNSINQQRLQEIGNILLKEVVCFVPNSSEFNTLACQNINPYHNKLDAVFIEGHTDNQAFAGDLTGALNRNLSTARSNTVYHYLVQTNKQLDSFKNSLGEKIFSISGYGEERPLPHHAHLEPTNDPANRRIEFRFIFAEPKLTKEEQKLLKEQAEKL